MISRFIKTWFLPELIRGLSVTGGYFFKKKFTIQVPGREDPEVAEDSVACTRCGVTRTARSAASHVSCARPYAPRSRSRLNRRNGKTGRAAPPDTILICQVHLLRLL